MNRVLSFVLFSFIAVSTWAQITCTANNSAMQLAQLLAGNGVTVSNATLTCPSGAAGTFVTNGCNLGMQQGLILTTGNVNTVAGPNNLGSAGIDNGGPGDAELDGLTASTTHNACVLEFDMQILSDSIEFRYAFGSDEYNEYVCSQFNDIFAFFISGPGIVGQPNIALIPGTNIPVSINSVNNGSPGASAGGGTCNQAGQSLAYSSFFTDNTGGQCLQYDGFTHVLTAKRKNLQPCQTYHLKLAVADCVDGVFDSGVFLEANSLTSNTVDVDDATTNVPNVSNAMEGCVVGSVRFHIQTAVPYPTTVSYTLGGTATNGVDYQSLPGSFTIPAGDTAAFLSINPIADGIVEGNETVVIYLSNACSAAPYDSAVLVIVDSLPAFIGPDTAVCAGSQVQLMATLASTYAWSPAGSLNAANIYNPIASPAATTTYYCSITIGQCNLLDSLTVSIMPPPFSVDAGPDLASCSGSVTINPVITGNPINGYPFQYSWSPAQGLSSTNTLSTTATPVSATTYTIQVQSANCIARDSLTVNLGSIQIDATSTDELCSGANDATATVNMLTGQSPYIIHWSNNQSTATITGLAPGAYTVTVTDNDGCTATDNVSPIAATPIYFNQPTIVDAKCFGGSDGSITITATGGNGSLGYSWNIGGSGSSANGLSAGNYIVSATDQNGCVADTTMTVGQAPQFLISTSSTGETCSGAFDGTATATPNNGLSPYQYAWDNGGNTGTITGLTNGTYNVTVTDGNTCQATGSVQVTTTNPIVFNAPQIQDVKCFGGNDGSITANATGGVGSLTYAWNNGGNTNTITGLTIGTYLVSVNDQGGCHADTSYVINQPTLLTVTATHTDAVCFGQSSGTVTASALGGTIAYSYLWNTTDNTPTVSALAAQTYDVTVTDANMCTASASTTVAEPAALSVQLGSTPPLCVYANDGSINAATVNGTSPFNYVLSFAGSNLQNNNTGIFGGLATGSYTVSSTDVNGCTATSTVFLNPPYADEFSITTDSTSCAGTSYNDGSIHITPVSVINQPYYYAVDNGGNQLTGDFIDLIAGNHTIVVTNKNGCITDTFAIVPEPALGSVSIVPGDTSMELGQSIQLTTSIAPFEAGAITSYTWSQIEGISCADCAEPVVSAYQTTDYTVTVTYGHNCVATASIKVEVNGEPPVFIPNAFSPNGDGNNDLFMVYGDAISKVDMSIFNRWGEEIFRSTDRLAGWDGTYKGQLQNPSVYTYVAAITYLDGKQIQKKGTVTILR